MPLTHVLCYLKASGGDQPPQQAADRGPHQPCYLNLLVPGSTFESPDVFRKINPKGSLKPSNVWSDLHSCSSVSVSSFVSLFPKKTLTWFFKPTCSTWGTASQVLQWVPCPDITCYAQTPLSKVFFTGQYKGRRDKRSVSWHQTQNCHCCIRTRCSYWPPKFLAPTHLQKHVWHTEMASSQFPLGCYLSMKEYHEQHHEDANSQIQNMGLLQGKQLNSYNRKVAEGDWYRSKET